MRNYRISGWLCSAAAAGLIAGISATASAQEEGGIALNRFNPAPAGDRMFGVQSPFVAGDPGLHLMLLGDYAHNPLVLARENSGEALGAVVGNQLFLHLNGSIALWNRLNINVEVPLAVVQSGDSPGASPYPSPSGVQLGDVRVGLRLGLLGEYFDAFQLAIGGYVWVPTGDGEAGSFVSTGKLRGTPQLIVGGRTDSLVWSAAVGPEFRSEPMFVNTELGMMLHGGAGIGFLLGDEKRFQIGPEINVSTVLEDPSKNNTNLELLVDARYRVLRDLEIGLGVGPGLTAGVGTPDVRAVAMIAYTPEQKKPDLDADKDGILNAADACVDVYGIASSDPKKHGCPDKDGDGVIDPSDACVDVAGLESPDPKKHGCPDKDKDGIIDSADACVDLPGEASDDAKKNGCPDKDKDGIIDPADACVDVAGVASDDPKKNGCPPDRDNDGVPDKEDACPDLAGLKTNDPATNGCPGDTDGDTIRDDKDACPLEKGKPDNDPKKNGCPQSVRVTEQEIVILQQVQFDINKATIKPVSNALLDEVGAVLKEHPEIARIEVQGHTDNTGNAKANETLSQNRANAVMEALVKRGVEAGRLTAKGYGQNVPVADNKTKEGKQLNRRVQFKILEKKAKPQK